jgi:hypothetical protein
MVDATEGDDDKIHAYKFAKSRRVSDSIVSDYGLDDRSVIPGRDKGYFPLASASRPASLGPTQPPIQWVPVALTSWVKRGLVVTLTTHPHLVPRSRTSKSHKCSPPKRLNGV